MYLDPERYVLRSAHRLKVTTGSSLLTSVSGGTAGFPSLCALALVREAGCSAAQQIHFMLGDTAASASTPEWPGTAGSIAQAAVPMTTATAEGIQVISASGDTYATLLVFGPPSQG